MNREVTMHDDMRTLDSALSWLRRHWIGRIAPSRLHEHAVEPESALGSPRLADAFRRYLDQRPGDVVTERVSETCHHPRLPQNARLQGCPDCDGLGVKEADRMRFRDPMWWAFTLLHGKYPPIRGQVGYAEMAFALVVSGYRPELAARLLSRKVVGGDVTWNRRDYWEPAFVLALRKLHSYYHAAPLPSVTWVDKSDAQRAAETAA